ncbi:nucleolar complex protein 14 [Purpureocillium takamizusanense]|uniref:Nucleolar complex protein 14 n=1 Tax=Purpureocillium takamizusanense TaxID=2060973 RepID=A0A9Q8Q8R4_9HYPO|nr:nucleolar complex protein 14 [Purpureocillium takamizusanense]UNI14521.1 nucleolar complex protein 14 [Purpureocillium takamizusanense]
MAGSQLKRLKASLREQGITGPQQSKRQKRKLAQDGRARNGKRLQRGVVLEGIRDQFNPFDLKHAKGPKFEVTSNKTLTGDAAKGIRGRPGQARAAGEERRRETLLVDMQRRNKVGGILDRRFGENDPTMTPEDKMLERFAREKQRSHRKSSMFDLEDDEPVEGGLTHGGKTLTFEDEEPVDDFQENDLDGYDSDGSVRERQRLKRIRAMASETNEDEDEQPDRKKTKKEVMEEIIAKSKMHKYERQAAKEDDEELRAELDKDLRDIQSLLTSASKTSQARSVANALASTIAGEDRDAFEKNYDLQVKQLAQDKRAQPTERTKTEEEKIEAESKRLRELEEKRQKRMRGEEVSDSEESENDMKVADEDANASEDDDFGLGSGIRTRPTATELGFDDEDDFIIDDDLVASGSELELPDSDAELDAEESGDDAPDEDDEEDDFTAGLLNEEEARNPVFKAETAAKASALQKPDEHGLPYTFPCPQTCEEFETITRPFPSQHIPTIVQRIRALYHPKLDSQNKERLANFSLALVDFISSEWNPDSSPSFLVLESVVRHIHSLSKMFAIEIAQKFRERIAEIGSKRPLAPLPSDLILLTAVGTIFPTSDHFHQVVTPAMLTIGRALGQQVPQNLADYAVATYLSIIALQYQQLSKRYVPELVNSCLNTICALAPTPSPKQSGNFPQHDPPTKIRLQNATGVSPRKLSFADCLVSDIKGRDATSLKVAILDTTMQILDAGADLWAGKEAFPEIFNQVASVLKLLGGQSNRVQLPGALCDQAEKLGVKLARMSRLAQISRRPLELHHHRPLAIKTYIPKFEETFDPDKHYDPDRERADLAKLKKEHKRERKGAMRELRKDANFMAREKLRIKKAKDEAYEKKYKRLVAEIQSEEGRESNAYDREKQARKRARNR